MTHINFPFARAPTSLHCNWLTLCKLAKLVTNPILQAPSPCLRRRARTYCSTGERCGSAIYSRLYSSQHRRKGPSQRDIMPAGKEQNPCRGRPINGGITDILNLWNFSFMVFTSWSAVYILTLFCLVVLGIMRPSTRGCVLF